MKRDEKGRFTKIREDAEEAVSLVYTILRLLPIIIIAYVAIKNTTFWKGSNLILSAFSNIGRENCAITCID